MQMVDQEGPDGKPHTVIESGAMLIYLTDKYGKFITQESIPRYQVVQLLMFQMGNIGAFFGQDHHFRRRADKVPYGIERYTKEPRRLLGVLDQHLATHEFPASEQYTIADIATFPWTRAMSGRASRSMNFQTSSVGSRRAMRDRRSSARWIRCTMS